MRDVSRRLTLRVRGMIRMFEARLKVYSSATTDFLRDYMESRNDIPQQLRSSMLYSLMAGGKRLRPALCMASCGVRV